MTPEPCHYRISVKGLLLDETRKKFLLVQEDNGRIVGVRAFMQWRWVQEGKVYKALRAVDTATHPDYQGKGIFKRPFKGIF